MTRAISNRAAATKLLRSSARYGDHGFTGAGLYMWRMQRDALLGALREIEQSGVASASAAEFTHHCVCPQVIEQAEGRVAGTTAGRNWVFNVSRLISNSKRRGGRE